MKQRKHARVTIGSSPRSWGTGSPGCSGGSAYRFIPTVVGNSAGENHSDKKQPVHPHGRGEQLKTRVFSRTTGRFIPTVVGNSKAKKESGLPLSVHPHGRGEQGCTAILFNLEPGSSPRSWGTAPNGCQTLSVFRFIPTVVGNRF